MRRLIQMPRRRPAMGSIVWGTRARLGLVPPLVIDGSGSTFIPSSPMPVTALPFPNPDTRPGVWPGLNVGPISQQPPQPQPVFTTNQGGTSQVPVMVTPTSGAIPPPATVVVTPTSGAIPPPATVAAGTAPAASWLDQQMIAGIPNKYLLIAGGGALLLMGGKRK